MELSDIITFVDKYGIKGIIVGVFLFFAYHIIKTDWFGDFFLKMVDRFLKKEKNKDGAIRKIKESDILNHDIFSYINFWVYSKIPTLKFSTEYRTLVFRKYLSIYLKSYKSNLEEFIVNKEYEKMDEPEILNTFLNLINKTVYDYEREMVESGIPNIIIEKMKSKNNDNILLIMDLIDGVCNSQFYDSENNLLKVYSVLNILLTVLESAINNSEGICNSINGALSGLVYNGIEEPKH